MPVANFPGRFGSGNDGCQPFRTEAPLRPPERLPAGQEVEITKEGAGARPPTRAPEQARGEFTRLRIDPCIGMGISNLDALFIVITTAATLNATGWHGRGWSNPDQPVPDRVATTGEDDRDPRSCALRRECRRTAFASREGSVNTVS